MDQGAAEGLSYRTSWRARRPFGLMPKAALDLALTL
jgi:hypothetical protein